MSGSATSVTASPVSVTAPARKSRVTRPSEVGRWFKAWYSVTVVTTSDEDWVFLVYRLPREPSAPRLALWRAVRRLGALQLGDGLVALPRTARNLEHLQWLAADITEHDGSATVWHARADSGRDHDAHVKAMQASVEEEFRAVLDEAEKATAREMPAGDRRRVVRRLRGQLRRTGLRDHFDAPTGPLARAAVDRLARLVEAVPA